jgi:hypothetical protein
MSPAHDAPGAMAHAHDDHEAFDGEPASTLSPGEPLTPGWLPLLGLGLFTALAIVVLAAGGGDQATAAVAISPPAPQAAAREVKAPSPAPELKAQAMPPSPDPAGAGGLHKLSSKQIEALKKKIEEAKAKGVLPNNAGQPPAH